VTDRINFEPLADDERANVEAEALEARSSKGKTPSKPPADAEPGEAAAAQLFGRAPDALWRYGDAAGVLAYCVCRWNKPDGEKEIRPLSWFDGEG
jgi:hypothetical protein